MIEQIQPQIEFDAATHTYRMAGEEWPSVTTVLGAAGLSDYSGVPQDALEYAQKRGTAVHKAAWWHDIGDLDESTVSPAIAGYVEAWKAFRRNTGFTPESIEQITWCKTYRYFGTYDRIGRFSDGRIAVVDLKTGPESPSWKYQLAGYARLHPEPLKRERIAVQLSKDGAYSVKPYKLADFRKHEAVFLSAVNLWWARKEEVLI